MEQVAGFAITDIAFNPSGSYLACSSVANSIAVIPVHQDLGRPWLKEMVMENLFRIIALAIIILAILFFVLTSRK